MRSAVTRANPFDPGRWSKRALLLACTLSLTPVVQAEQRRGVINDPDGYVNVRAGKSNDAPVIGRVKQGEPFTFECDQEDEWCRARLRSGKSGWMHRNRIRLFFTEKDLPAGYEKGSEIDEFTRGRGFDYTTVTRRAARGDMQALKQFFELADGVDGAAAESYAEEPTTVYHLLGDEKFAKFLREQPLAFRVLVRSTIVNYCPMEPATDYLRSHFPETTEILFRQEITDWPSPDGRYAIRKKFSDPFDLNGSKVVRAELIDTTKGAVLCDLTRDDIGTGHEREGEVLWAPDSQRFAYLSSDLTMGGSLFTSPPPPPQRKQTAVYQAKNGAFERIELPLSEIPERESDDEVKRAVLGHEHTTPVRWETPDVLVLARHEYYQTLKPTQIDHVQFESIRDFDRHYEITVTIPPAGPAKASWKVLEDRP